MKYPMEEDAMRDCYRSYTGEEPEEKTSKLLDAMTEALNQAYIDGVQEGMNRIKDVWSVKGRYVLDIALCNMLFVLHFVLHSFNIKWKAV